MDSCRMIAVVLVTCLVLGGLALAEPPAAPWTVTDYDENDWYLVRGDKKLSYHGVRQSWVFNRAMVWLDKSSGVDGSILCYSEQSPLPLSGKKQVSRWYAGPGNELAETDERFTRLTKKNADSAWDHACLPPVQFEIEQHATAEFEVREATHPWQFVAVVKGRSGPPLFASPWQTGPGKLSVDLLGLYRKKGYDHHFAEMVFFVAVWTEDPKQPASVEFRLSLAGPEVIVPTLPIVRTAKRAKAEGVPISAVVLDRQARRLGRDTVEVTVSLGQGSTKLVDDGRGIWKAVVRDLPPGQHQAELRARWKADPQKSVVTRLGVRVTDGQFVGYDSQRRLLTRDQKPLGPITGSYRGQSVFKGVGTPGESLLHGQEQWQAAIADPKRPDYGFHFWESLTPQELDQDYAYLQRCGWRMIHLCSAWLWWPRFDAAGRLSPFCAEQLDVVSTAAERHGLVVHLAVSHYPLGLRSPPYTQYLEAGYQPSDYGDPQSKFFAMFTAYLAQLAEVFRDDTTLSSFTPAGEGDPTCGMAFVNMVSDGLARHDGNHLVMAEPHHQVTQHPSYYRQAGCWKAVLGGMRTYYIDRLAPETIGVQFKLASMGDVFMGEGCFYGFLGGNHQYMNPQMPIDGYRRRVRETIYTGLAHRNPILLTWEERIVEDERVVFEEIRRAVDWSTPFQRPPVAIRVDKKLMPVAGRGPLFRYEEALSQIPAEAFYVWEDEPVPPGTVATLDARGPFVTPAFVADGGTLPDELKARLPLALPAGWTANYSWSDDRRTLLAFLRRLGGDRIWDTAEGGDYTCVDTTLRIEKDGPIDTWETRCLKPGKIQLRIYRQEGSDLVLVGQSDLVEMARSGRCRFTLKTPIAARQGDLIGFYIPSADTEIAAQHEGRMLYVEGPAADRSPLGVWKTEAKRADLTAFCAADVAQAPRRPVPSRSGLSLDNFLREELSFQLFDLAGRKSVAEGAFRERKSLDISGKGDHFFLLVRPGR